MADYTIYNRHYQYMEQVLNSLKVQNNRMSSARVNQSSFAEVLADTNEKSIAVPESMDAIFEEAARTYDVPVNLLKAMAKAESNFDEKAVSSAGAQGVMQLMPATAKSLGVKDPFDARQNIMGGAKYISQKLKQYNGDLDLALAAYNAGSGNVRKYGGVPPFKETRNYIKKIKEYMGTDLHVDKQVMTENSRGNTRNNLTEIPEQTSISNALFIVELMKTRLQMQINNNILL